MYAITGVWVGSYRTKWQMRPKNGRKRTRRTVFGTVSHRHLWFILEVASFMVARWNTNEDKTSFNLERSVNRKSKYSIFGQKSPKMGHFWVPYCVTGTVTLVLESHLVSFNWRHMSRGRIPSSYMLWMDLNEARGGEIWLFVQMSHKNCTGREKG